MTDNFALLNEPRRPWLDTSALKQKFLTLSASVHPDKIHSAGELEKSGAAKSFAELNAAYTCLAEPKSRLLHLLELELGAKPKDIQQIPTALADLFAEVAMTCRSTDGFLVEKSKATSPLLQVQLFERAQEWVEKLNVLQQKLNGLHDQLMSELKSLDEKWMSPDAASRHEVSAKTEDARRRGAAATTASRHDVLAKAEELYRLFGYFNRWNKQIQERVVQLSF